jgi:hypothetical protein
VRQRQELVGDLVKVAVQPQPHHPAGDCACGDGMRGGGDRAGGGHPGEPQRFGPMQAAQAGLGLPLGAHGGSQPLGGPLQQSLVVGRDGRGPAELKDGSPGLRDR